MRGAKDVIWLLAISVTCALGAVIQQTALPSSTPQTLSSTVRTQEQSRDRYSNPYVRHALGLISHRNSLVHNANTRSSFSSSLQHSNPFVFRERKDIRRVSRSRSNKTSKKKKSKKKKKRSRSKSTSKRVVKRDYDVTNSTNKTVPTKAVKVSQDVMAQAQSMKTSNHKQTYSDFRPSAPIQQKPNPTVARPQQQMTMNMQHSYMQPHQSPMNSQQSIVKKQQNPMNVQQIQLKQQSPMSFQQITQKHPQNTMNLQSSPVKQQPTRQTFQTNEVMNNHYKPPVTHLAPSSAGQTQNKGFAVRNGTHIIYLKNLSPYDHKKNIYSINLGNRNNIIGVVKINNTNNFQHFNAQNKTSPDKNVRPTRFTNNKIVPYQSKPLTYNTRPAAVVYSTSNNANPYTSHYTPSQNQNSAQTPFHPSSPVNIHTPITSNGPSYLYPSFQTEFKPVDSYSAQNQQTTSRVKNPNLTHNITYTRDPEINEILNENRLHELMGNSTNKTLPSVVVTKVNKVSKKHGNVNVTLETIVEIETQYEYHKLKPGEFGNFTEYFYNATNGNKGGKNKTRIIRTKRNKTTKSTSMNIELINNNATSNNFTMDENTMKLLNRNCSQVKNPDKCKQRQARKRKEIDEKMKIVVSVDDSEAADSSNTNIQVIKKKNKESDSDIVYGKNKFQNTLPSSGIIGGTGTEYNGSKYDTEKYGWRTPNKHVLNYAISTSNKKPVIHKVVTRWSDTPNYDQIITKMDTADTADNADEFNFSNDVSSVKVGNRDSDNMIGNQAMVSSSINFGGNYTKIQNINQKMPIKIQTKPTTDKNVQFDGDVFFIRPNPSTLHSPSNLQATDKPPSFDIQNYYHESDINDNVDINPFHDKYPSAIAITSRPTSHTTLTLNGLTPTYSFSTNIDDDSDRPDSYGSNSQEDDKNNVPLSSTGVDCPTVYVSINNSLKSESKEGCADIHLVINTNLQTNNILASDPQTQADPVADSLAESSFSYLPPPVVPPVPIVPIAAGPAPNAVGIPPVIAPLGAADPSVFGAGEAPAVGGGGGVPAAVPPAGGASGGKPPRAPGLGHGSKPSHDDDDDAGLTSIITSATKMFAFMSILNPFNFGLYSLFFAPLTIFAVGGVGLAALMTPWVWSGVMDRQAKEVIYVKRKPNWHWKWDDSHKSWNWVSFPSTRADYNRMKDPRMDRAEIEEKSSFRQIMDNIWSAWSNVMEWFKSMMHNGPKIRTKRHTSNRALYSKGKLKKRRK